MPILVAILVGFGGFAIYADRIEHRNRLADLDAELVRASQRSNEDPPPAGGRPVTQPQEDQAPTNPDGTNPVQLLISLSGVVMSTGPSQNPFSEATIARILTIDGFATASDENYRMRVTLGAREPQTIAVTALPLDSLDQATKDFRRSLAIGGGIIVALVTLVVWLLLRTLTQPILRITSVANRIANGELDTDLDVRTRSQELTDLTEDLDRMLTQLRSTLAQSEQSATDATQARDDMQRFLADMAHELRTPLTALKGYSDLYAGGMLETSTDVDRAMSRIGSESERLYRLVDDMLQLARKGAPKEATERVDIAEIAALVIDDLRAANPNHVLRLEILDGRHAVTGTPSRIHQAILNLGANACAHSEPGDEVVISVSSDDSSVLTRVIDKGPGISASMRDQVFLPFFRGDTSRSRQGHGGAGLGLALTKQIAELHQGSIEIKATPGGGATVVLSLPSNDPQR